MSKFFIKNHNFFDNEKNNHFFAFYFQPLFSDGATKTVFDYLNGVEYKDGSLDAIYHGEGRVKKNGTIYRYEYALKDHLGNTRVFFTDATNNGVIDKNDIIQENHYYAFGMAYDQYPWGATTTPNKYKYNGKELNEDFGLNLSDYGARWYDASIGRWLSPDPLAEQYRRWSPYNYTMNNPIRFIDPDGMQVEGDYYGWEGNYLGTDGEDDNKVYVADAVEKNAQGLVTSATNQQDLGVGHDVFLMFASMVYQESDSKVESYAIANATVNFLKEGGSSRLKTIEDIAAYPNTYAFGSSQKWVDAYKKEKSNSKGEIGATINAIMGYLHPANGHYPDYSEGSNQWDGMDLVDTHFQNPAIKEHRNYIWNGNEASKTLLKNFQKDLNGGINVSDWHYSEKGYKADPRVYYGNTLFYYLSGGNGGSKTSNTRIKY